MIVAIDTSTERASIAINDGELRAEHSWRSRGEQTRELLPALDFLLRAAGASTEPLEGVVVATGPGSFNGLRVGVSTAKGLALARDIPIVGVPTLDVIAYQHLYHPNPVYAVVRAGRGRIAFGRYSVGEGTLDRLGDFRNASVLDLCREIDAPALVAGEVTPEMAEEIRRLAGGPVAISGGAAGWHRAGYLAEIGRQHLERNQVDDLASLQPIYLSQPTMGRAQG